MKVLFPLAEEELKMLKKKDIILKSYIDSVGNIERYYEDDIFQALIGSFISQLVATKTADNIYQRLVELVKELSAESILRTDDEELRSCGISLKKVRNIKYLCQDIVTGKLGLEELSNLSAEEIIKLLTAYPGIGLWTVEMLLIFTLQRKDIISYGDLGIRSGMQKLYGIEKLDKKTYQEIKEKVSPHGSLASIYYWHAHSNL